MLSPIAGETLYNIMIYGLMGEELKATIPFKLSGHPGSSENPGLSKDCEVVIASTQEAAEIVEEKGIHKDQN